VGRTRLRQRRPDRPALSRAAALAALVLLLALASAAGASGRSPSYARSDDGAIAFEGHVFPVDGPHGTRGYIGEFGAPRDGGRTHEGFDIVAACGTPLVAVRTGRVLSSGYDPVLYGNYLLIHGEGEHRSYFYAHMRHPALVHRGEEVYAGERVGVVGKTGNARTVGCHLHFEIHVHGVAVNPEAALHRWDRYS
jgi:murein DD-endopeptidase MepM/ murein hydrolase activator NlpD